MINRAGQRLKELRAEFESGQKVLAELEGKVATTRSTLLRISGAIQVLEELLAVGSLGQNGISAEPVSSRRD